MSAGRRRINRVTLVVALFAALLATVGGSAAADGSGASPMVVPEPPGSLAVLFGDYRGAEPSPEAAADQNDQERKNRPFSLNKHGELTKTMAEAVEQRRLLGLSTDRDHVRLLRENPALRAIGDVEAYGIALDRAEIREMDSRFAAQDRSYQLLDYIVGNLADDQYAGLWWDDDSGKYFLGVTRDASSVRESLQESYQYPERVGIVTRRYSMLELEEIKTNVAREVVESKDEQPFRVVLASANAASNTVRIGVDGDLVAATTHFGEEYGPDRVTVYREAIGRKAISERETTFWQPTRGGLVIKNVTEGGKCSSGFVARKSDGSRWLLTDGHCDVNATSYPMFSQGGTNLNPLEMRNNTTCQGGSAFRDVGGINLVSALWSHFIYASSSDKARHIHSYHPHGAVQSGNVQISLANSNVSSIRTVVDTDVFYTWYDDPTCFGQDTYSLGLKQFNGSYVQGGDSGSPVFQADIAEGMVEGGPNLYYTVDMQLDNGWSALETSAT